MPRLERRKNFRVNWNLPATIYDVERHLERPCILSDPSGGGRNRAEVCATIVMPGGGLCRPIEGMLPRPQTTISL
jgi:hypothetical protein